MEYSTDRYDKRHTPSMYLIEKNLFNIQTDLGLRKIRRVMFLHR